MNENNNFGSNMNPGQPVQPNTGMNPGQPVQSNMGMNPGQPVQSNMGMNPGQPVQPNIGMNPGQPVQPNMGMNPGQPKKATNKKTLIIIISVVAAIAIAIIALLFLGGSKTLTCTSEQAVSGMNMKNTIIAKFKNNNVDKMEIKIDVDLGELSAYKDNFISTFESEYDSLKEQGANVVITSDDRYIHISVSAEKELFEEMGYSSKGTYKEAKTEFESQGMTCK